MEPEPNAPEQSEAAEQAPEAVPSTDTEQVAESRGFSVEDAWAQAREALDSDEESDEGGQGDAASPDGQPGVDATGEQQSPTTQTAAPETPDKGQSFQANLDRLRSLVEEGREGELTPAERGVLDRIRRQVADRHTAEQQAFNEAKDAFLALDALINESPEDWAAHSIAEPEKAARELAFYKDFKSKHPDISTVTPEGDVTNPERVRTEAQRRVFEAFDQAVVDVAGKHGVKPEKLAQLYDAATTPWEYLGNVVEAVVESHVASEVEKRLVDERKAIQQEMQAKYTPKIVKPPVTLGGLPGSGKAPARSGPISIEEAFAAAKERAAQAG